MARGNGRAHRSSRHEFGDRDVARIRAAGAARLLWCGKLRGAASIKIGSRLSSWAGDTRRRSPSQKRARTVLGGDVVGSEPTASLRQPALFLLSWPTRGRVPAGGSAKTRRKSRWWSSASPVPQNTTKMGNKKVAVVLLEVKKVVQTPTKGVLGFPRCMEGGAKIILLPGQFYVGCQPFKVGTPGGHSWLLK